MGTLVVCRAFLVSHQIQQNVDLWSSGKSCGWTQGSDSSPRPQLSICKMESLLGRSVS